MYHIQSAQKLFYPNKGAQLAQSIMLTVILFKSIKLDYNLKKYFFKKGFSRWLHLGSFALKKVFFYFTFVIV